MHKEKGHNKKTKLIIYETLLSLLLVYGHLNRISEEQMKMKLQDVEMNCLINTTGIAKSDKSRNDLIRTELKLELSEVFNDTIKMVFA